MSPGKTWDGQKGQRSSNKQVLEWQDQSAVSHMQHTPCTHASYEHKQSLAELWPGTEKQYNPRVIDTGPVEK